MKHLKIILTGILPIIITIIGELDDAPGAILIGVLIIVRGAILNIRLIKNLFNHEFDTN